MSAYPGRRRALGVSGGVGVGFGFICGLLLWGILLGARVYAPEPGLWTLRFERAFACGLDYSGPPYRSPSSLWVTCGEGDAWQVW